MASVHPARAPPSDAAIGTAAVLSDGDGTGRIAADVAARASSGNGGTPDAPAARKTMTKHPSVEQFAIDADEEGAPHASCPGGNDLEGGLNVEGAGGGELGDLGVFPGEVGADGHENLLEAQVPVRLDLVGV